ncbi:pyridoxal 5'-phosphate synthase glutaminase subunit PdxT [Agrococcus sp. SCSIO52902]|uniref:pyridoxal 5'-phosphate synthase glutaminase subunit PdxT n=1 Tax=Agrococcus sp. SCSIO52902 TaxID=2933290 RepID=UPI001FF249CF|nr:pyridoxal 5'-phosphate synthase glutaminase subunit PdxT [Agrococcus sp. SCSIO52902]UOW02188.1 pyridoxal 5'-phosphate synthase glutaminase subunit PdxT [Agrococcus sp. SCSIO52902]
MVTAGRPRVGVLALQGDVREHVAVLEALGAEVALVRTPAQLAQVAGLVLPGGESSVIDKLSRLFEVREPIIERIAGGMPVYGTCAGMILLADRILDGLPTQLSFGGLDVDVRRNAFGSQVDSFEAELAVPALGDEPVRATFIRAPAVERVGAAATALASVDGRVVAVEQGSLLATAFHPEVGGELRFHRRFLDRVRAAGA